MYNETPVKVLMVCLGNICRSPTAEAVFRSLVNTRGLHEVFYIDSAGTSDWHVGDAPDRRSQLAAAKRGYDLRSLRGRQVQHKDFEDFDYLLAMDRSNYRGMLSMCPPSLQNKVSLFLSHGSSGEQEVPDPYNSGPEGFELVLDLVEDASSALLDKIIREHKLT